MEEEELIKELEKLGWSYGYLGGHGDTEAVTKIIDGEVYVVGDIEKSRVIIPPECLWKDKIKYKDY